MYNYVLHTRSNFLCIKHIVSSFTDENGTLNGDELEEVPFHETRFFVPSSYSAGPNPERSSLKKSSSGNMSTVNALVISFSVLLGICIVVVIS